MINDMVTLAEALPREIQRVSELAALYDTVPYGCFAARLMRLDVEAALKAIAGSDIVKMLVAYEGLKEYSDD